MYRLGLGPKLRPSTKVVETIVETTIVLTALRVGTLDRREVEEAKVT